MDSRYKKPVKPISPKERRARSEQALAVLADLNRQATGSSVVTKASLQASLTGPKLLHITVPDNDDWYAFCVNLLDAGQTQWWYQGDRASRSETGDTSLFSFKTLAEWEKALLRVGRLYLDTLDVPRTKVGRPNIFGRCWRAFYKELESVRKKGHPKISYDKRMTLLMNGHPITQVEIARMIRKGDSTLSTGDPARSNTKPPPPLSIEVCRKYARVLYLAQHMGNPPKLAPCDDRFLTKYLLPFLKKA